MCAEPLMLPAAKNIHKLTCSHVKPWPSTQNPAVKRVRALQRSGCLVPPVACWFIRLSLRQRPLPAVSYPNLFPRHIGSGDETSWTVLVRIQTQSENRLKLGHAHQPGLSRVSMLMHSVSICSLARVGWVDLACETNSAAEPWVNYEGVYVGGAAGSEPSAGSV